MRLLADENFPGDAVAALHEQSHDVLWIRTHAPGSPDPVVLALAQKENRILSGPDISPLLNPTVSA